LYTPFIECRASASFYSILIKQIIFYIDTPARLRLRYGGATPLPEGNQACAGSVQVPLWKRGASEGGGVSIKKDNKMKNAIILHGVYGKDGHGYWEDGSYRPKDSPSNSHWLPWLQKMLLFDGILAQTPELPRPWVGGCDYSEWKDIFGRFPISENTILVGHSAGGGFLLKYLSLNKDAKAGHLILVAPWLDLEKEGGTFLGEFVLDPDLPSRMGKIDLFYSTDDDDYIINSVAKIRETYPNIDIHEFHDKGHFCENDIGTEFPELLAVVE
jgi:predicted alpha/beta hydrolase family esterase